MKICNISMWPLFWSVLYITVCKLPVFSNLRIYWCSLLQIWTKVLSIRVETIGMTNHLNYMTSAHFTDWSVKYIYSDL